MKLCAYFTAGFPDLESSLFIMKNILEVADILEIGIPFSDPIADGPTIQKASEMALKHGFKVNQAFQIAKELKEKFPEKELVFMTYYNIVFRKGIQNFISEAKKAGIWGIVIPDLIPEEANEVMESAKKEDVKTIFLVAPTTKPQRAKKICEMTNGFIYYVSVKGVTGEREKLPDDIKDNLKVLKKFAGGKNVFVGFGISRKEHVDMLKGYADGIIVGSAIIKKVIEENDLKKAVKSIKDFLSELAS
jgi:tryptophan synthase alpha chain